MLSDTRMHPRWKYLVRRVLVDPFQLGDHEYILAQFHAWPFSAWITKYEPGYFRGWRRRVMPFRVRFALAGLLSRWLFSRCTVCGAKITLRELLSRQGLTHYQSGSICHRGCSDAIKEATDEES